MHSILDGHERIALHVSGGKDSLACVYLLRPHLHRITIYHVDTGDQLPELQASIEHIKSIAPHFQTITTNVAAWQREHGIPTDVMPSGNDVAGIAMGRSRAPLAPRHACCWSNIMWPLAQRTIQDGNTLIIRGSKQADMPTLPMRSGDTEPYTNIQLYLPLEEWDDAKVLNYLRTQGAPIPRFYTMLNTSPDCGHCSGWWEERRGAYLKRYHPGIYQEYRLRLLLIRGELLAPMSHLSRELGS